MSSTTSRIPSAGPRLEDGFREGLHVAVDAADGGLLEVFRAAATRVFQVEAFVLVVRVHLVDFVIRPTKRPLPTDSPSCAMRS
jgi:hypothetical protein